MKKLRKIKSKVCCKQQVSLTLFVVKGAWHDISHTITLIIHLGAYPFHALARLLRRHRLLQFKHSHTVICISLGGSVMALSYFLEHLYNHPVWGATIETTRAAAACPIWDSISALTKVSKDLENNL